MYQAIVFLPLLGAILAGLITLAGARARFPGKGPSSGAEDAATNHGPHHGGLVVRGGAVVQPSHREEEGYEPAAVGSRTAELITTTLLLIPMILAWVAFVDGGFAHPDLGVPDFLLLDARR